MRDSEQGEDGGTRFQRHERSTVERVLAPDWLWTGEAWLRGAAVAVGGDGRVVAVGPLSSRDFAGAPPVTLLEGRALLPGFVNAHSHAFQRGIRGRTHTRRSEATDDFWSWRQSMHHATLSLDPDGLRALCTRVFREMLAAGFTSVGEFHYVHHAPGGQPYSQRNALALAVIEAALETGIRLCLLRAIYLRTGFEGALPTAGQLRFIDPDVDHALAAVDDLLSAVRAMGHDRVSVGVAPHSVRALAPNDLARTAEWARSTGSPLHIHAAEQPAEVASCLAHTGQRPVELLCSTGVAGPRATLVHATHVTSEEISALAATGAGVCVCPSTEADLGDGLAQITEFRAAEVPLCIGSDSQALIDPWTELRSLEWHERLRVGRRNCVVDPATGAVGPALLAIGSRAGARALGLATGLIEAGQWADLVSVRLDDPLFHGVELEHWASALAMGGGRALVDGVWVGGQAVELR
jgi:formimidoylglutamate deiminase